MSDEYNASALHVFVYNEDYAPKAEFEVDGVSELNKVNWPEVLASKDDARYFVRVEDAHGISVMQVSATVEDLSKREIDTDGEGRLFLGDEKAGYKPPENEQEGVGIDDVVSEMPEDAVSAVPSVPSEGVPAAPIYDVPKL